MHKRFLRDGDLDRIIITLKKEFNGKNNENITVAKGGVCLDSMVILFERSRKTLIKVEKYIGLWKTKDIQTYNTLCHVASRYCQLLWMRK